MLIANPLYDVVFKYLLEDVDIARELLSAILGFQIESLEVKPQETIIETAGGANMLRFDFKAVITKPSGEQSKVLIELQKAKQYFDVSRFRRYLGDNYIKEDRITNELTGDIDSRPLPIISIYFLGFKLDSIPVGVVKINRVYLDVVTDEILDIKEDFVELLTHDCYVIQVKKLPQKSRNELERILQIFSPVLENQDDRHRYNFQGSSDVPLVKRMLERLERAIASDEIRAKMDMEDEMDRIFEREMKKLATEKDEIIAKKERLLEKEKKKVEKQKQRAEKAEKDKELAENIKNHAEKQQQKAEAEKEKAEQTLRNSIALMLQSGMTREAIAKGLAITPEELDRLNP